MNRQNWTQEEDKLLRYVVQINGSQDWSKNSQQLRNISNTAMNKKRTGKQCRQRWYNHLDPNVLKSQWKDQEEGKLFQMHKIYGNKWKELSKYLPGRTDNDIKNHFYSTLRRSLRRLNKYIGQKNSTNQMREIKPSVLTFIINHIYSAQLLEQKQRTHRSLINSLKELPQLIFKFSSFKPVKNNMDKKVDENVRDRILTILGLVDQFKELYNKQKNIDDMEHNKIVRKKNGNGRNKDKIQNKETSVMVKFEHNEESYEDQDGQQEEYEEMIVKEEYNSAQDLQGELNPQKNYYQHYSPHKQTQKQFTPIVTIQRKPSLYQKSSSKKLVLTQQRIPQNFKIQQQHHHIKIPFHFLDERIQNQLMSIEQPSMELNQNSNFFDDLVVVGKHIQPLQGMLTNQQQNQCQIDEILYENYQN